MTTYLGAEPTRASCLVANNYLSQPLSVVVRVGITFAVVRVVPEILDPIEEVLFVLTGSEYDLLDAFDGASAPNGSTAD